MTDTHARWGTESARASLVSGARRWAIPSLLAVCMLVYFYAPLRTVAYPDVFEDDFFYYLVVAKHILAGQGSTFDGTHLTNGYHPLWMAVFLVLSPVFHGRALFIAFSVLIAGLLLWGYSSVVACLRVYTTRIAAQSIAAFLTVNLLLLAWGMEIALAVPLLFFLCRYRLLHFKWRPWQGFVYGLLGAATVLARLDCALFVLMLAVLDMALSSETPWKVRLGAAGPFVAGMLPVLAYLAFNHFLFGTAMPISSHAKELRFHHGFVRLPVRAVLHMFYPESSTLIYPVTLGFAVSVGLLLARGAGRLPRGQRGVVWALLLFLPAHLAVLSFSSDWPVWRWYLYSFLVSGLGAALVLLTREEKFFLRRYPFTRDVALLLFIFAAGKIVSYNQAVSNDLRSSRYSFFFAAQDLARFAEKHPGVYAMGDRAGMVGYYLPDPMIQTEGLMMDTKFLENIREQRNLLTVLRAYGVRYFIASDPVRVGPCLLAREPAQGGPDVPTMRGLFCAPPVHTFESADHIRNDVFDLAAAVREYCRLRGRP